MSLHNWRTAQKIEQLTPNLHVTWPYPLHLELGRGLSPWYKERLHLLYFHTIYKEVVMLQKILFQHTDELYIVTQSYANPKQTAYPNVLKRYMKTQHMKYRIHAESFIWQFDDEQIPVSQLSWKCRAADVKWQALFQAIIHQDFGRMRPQLKSQHSIFTPSVFIINTQTNCIFHLYDDRGCEILCMDETYYEQLTTYFETMSN